MTLAPTIAASWPSERGRYSGVLLQFGQARADLARLDHLKQPTMSAVLIRP